MSKYQNFYEDIREFMLDLQRQIGLNVAISLIMEDGNLEIGIHFKKIPMYAKLPPFQVKMEEADFKEPGDNLTKVILDQLTDYLARHTVKK